MACYIAHIAALAAMLAWTQVSARTLMTNGVAQEWEQCGGRDWQGPTICAAGLVCEEESEWYSQCRRSGEGDVAQQYEQCGGRGWQGPTECTDALECTPFSDFYSQCLRPGSANSPPDAMSPAVSPDDGAGVGPTAGPAGPPSEGEASTVAECEAIVDEQGILALPCGCPSAPCCGDDICVTGAKCVTFTEEFTAWSLSPGDAACVAVPAAGQECGALDAPCCFDDTAPTPFDGRCTEDTADERAACDYQQLAGPLCKPGPRKLSDAPDCGAEEFDVCCTDETCQGALVCRGPTLVDPRDPFWSRGPAGPRGLVELQCYDCEVRVGEPCGNAADGAECCDYISVYKGYDGNLECVAADGGGGATTCERCGQEGEPCCTNVSVSTLTADGCDEFRACSTGDAAGVCNDGVCGCPA